MVMHPLGIGQHFALNKGHGGPIDPAPHHIPPVPGQKMFRTDPFRAAAKPAISCTTPFGWSAVSVLLKNYAQNTCLVIYLSGRTARGSSPAQVDYFFSNARTSRRRILPIKDLGRVSRNSMIFGTLYAASSCLHSARMLARTSSEGVKPVL